MKQIGLCLLFLICIVAVLKGENKPRADKPAARWEEAISQFEDWDQKNSFASDGVLFVGSSSIRLWPTAEDFGEFPVINRGFGGSQISDVNYFAGRIVLPYEPKVIVFYAGDNDVAKGKSAKRVFVDYQKFVRLVHEKLTKTKIIFIAIKPSGSRWALWPVMAEANKMIEDFCGKDGRLYYFDSATPLLGADGKPDAKLFLKDKLHLNPEGYRAWTRALKPIVAQAMANRGKPAHPIRLRSEPALSLPKGQAPIKTIGMRLPPNSVAGILPAIRGRDALDTMIVPCMPY